MTMEMQCLQYFDVKVTHDRERESEVDCNICYHLKYKNLHEKVGTTWVLKIQINFKYLDNCDYEICIDIVISPILIMIS